MIGLLLLLGAGSLLVSDYSLINRLLPLSFCLRLLRFRSLLLLLRFRSLRFRLLLLSLGFRPLLFGILSLRLSFSQSNLKLASSSICTAGFFFGEVTLPDSGKCQTRYKDENHRSQSGSS